MTRSTQREPIFNFSEPAPVQFAGLLVALHALFQYSPLGRSAAVGNLLVLRPADQTEGLGWISTIGHAFAHANWTHVLTNSAMLIVFAILTMRGARALAIRKGRTPHPVLSYVAVFLFTVMVGAFAQWAWWGIMGGAGQSAVGASGGVSGLFAAGAWAMGGRDTLIKFGIGWAIINAMMVAFEGVLGFGLAWPAHLGGYLGGMIIAPFVAAPFSTGFDPR